MKLHFKRSFVAFFRLVRGVNLLILALTQIFVRIFIIGPREEWSHHLTDWKFILLVIATNFVAAAGYIINDYYDIKIDLINKPKRVVIGKVFTRRIAIFGHFMLNFMAVGMGFLLSIKIGLLIAACGFIMWLYSNILKRLAFIGNLAISMLTGLSLYIITFLYPINIRMVLVYAVFAFFISLIREIIKDIEDMKGDARFGCKTLPIVWGIRKTKTFVFILTAIFVIALFILTGKPDNSLIYYFFGFILPPLLWLFFKLVQADTTRDYHLLSRICKVIMLCGIASMLFV